MEIQNEHNTPEEITIPPTDHILSSTESHQELLLEGKKTTFWKWVAIGFIFVFAMNLLFEISITIRPRFYSSTPRVTTDYETPAEQQTEATLTASVLPAAGVTLPVRWGDLGKQMVDAGVIDGAKFEATYAQRGGLDENAKQLLYGAQNGALVITEQNSGILLNLLWALGLGNKNEILEKGPMTDKQYGGADKFASTGGWTLAKGNVMNHYSMHAFMTLTSDQQALVARVSQNIYRPCCGNSVYFPDCNHGMAMLGLLELMASQGASEQQMYKTALAVNAYWFPDTYTAIAKYFAKRGVAWANIDPKEALGAAYSSAQGYRQILTEVEPSTPKGGGGCGV
ncbi:MAG: hypothetical protein NUV61_03970 [Candidatus Azambacteria bacterium]|nr:hypothetical protein [Candidatus Azambacteria bacterium]